MKRVRCIMALMIIGALAVGNLFPGDLVKRTQAATSGMWVLTEEVVFVKNQYIASDQTMKDIAEKNGWGVTDYRMDRSNPGTENFTYFYSDGSKTVSPGRYVRNDS